MKRLTTLLSTLVGMMSTNVFAEYGLVIFMIYT